MGECYHEKERYPYILLCLYPGRRGNVPGIYEAGAVPGDDLRGGHCAGLAVLPAGGLRLCSLLRRVDVQLFRHLQPAQPDSGRRRPRGRLSVPPGARRQPGAPAQDPPQTVRLGAGGGGPVHPLRRAHHGLSAGAVLEQ